MILSIEILDVAKLRKKFSEIFGIGFGVEKNFFSEAESGFGVKKCDPQDTSPRYDDMKNYK